MYNVTVPQSKKKCTHFPYQAYFHENLPRFRRSPIVYSFNHLNRLITLHMHIHVDRLEADDRSVILVPGTTDTESSMSLSALHANILSYCKTASE